MARKQRYRPNATALILIRLRYGYTAGGTGWAWSTEVFIYYYILPIYEIELPKLPTPGSALRSTVAFNVIEVEHPC
jgi:hypothetical protein